MDEKSTTLIGWDKICRPKQLGGLSILNVATRNKVLLMKNPHKFSHKENLPWINFIQEKYYISGPPSDKLEGSFWWKAHLHLLDSYQQFATCTAGRGDTSLMWRDKWRDEALLNKFPELHSYAKNDKESLDSYFAFMDWTDKFHLPLSNQVFEQATKLQSLKPQLQHSRKDEWICLGRSSKLSSIKFYNSLIGGQDAHELFSVIWKMPVD